MVGTHPIGSAIKNNRIAMDTTFRDITFYPYEIGYFRMPLYFCESGDFEVMDKRATHS
jgi:hypothetical protein